MEVKINREIRQFKGTVFFGLTLRQVVCAITAIASSIASLMWLSPKIGSTAASWVSIVVAVPAGLVGFVPYNGMPFEKIAWAWFKSQILEPKRLCVAFQNLYAPIYEPLIAAERGEAENTKRTSKKKRKEKSNEAEADTGCGKTEPLYRYPKP